MVRIASARRRHTTAVRWRLLSRGSHKKIFYKLLQCKKQKNMYFTSYFLVHHVNIFLRHSNFFLCSNQLLVAASLAWTPDCSGYIDSQQKDRHKKIVCKLLQCKKTQKCVFYIVFFGTSRKYIFTSFQFFLML